MKKPAAPRRRPRRRPARVGPGLTTRAVHAGGHFDPATGAFHTPIFQQATFGTPTARRMLELGEGTRAGNFYMRYDHPNYREVERKVAALEGAPGALLFGSGMAAITTAVLARVKAGDHIVSTESVYGGTYGFFSGLLPRLGVRVDWVDGGDLGAVRAALRSRPRLLYAESPVNPTLTVLDVAALARAAKAAGVPMYLDATFASPVNQQPVKLGVSLVLHSGTKYLGGHSDLMAGLVAGSRALLAPIEAHRRVLGGVADPHQAWLLARGLRTLTLRVARQNEVALAVARHLERHPRVRRVLYPGLKSHPQHALARRQLRGFGGMVTFEVRGGLKAASRVAERLKLIQLGPSLGGVESLVSLPVLTSHVRVPAEARRRLGISEGLLRLSCGIEDPADLVADLDQALRRG